MILWICTPISSSHVAFGVDQPRIGEFEALMLMDAGQRFLCSLRHADPYRRSFPYHPHRSCLFAAHQRSDGGFSPRCIWHGNQREDKLLKLMSALVKFGAALRTWRSWVLVSERLANRCFSHQVSADAVNIQGVISDEQQTIDIKERNEQSSLEAKICTEKGLVSRMSNQYKASAFLDCISSPLDDHTKENSFSGKTTVAHVGPDGLSSIPIPNFELANPAIIVFDIETTGFKLSDDRIIEFAARDLAGGDCSTLQTLVNPERYIPIHATNVHGIHSSMVNKKDIPRWKEVAPTLLAFVESRRVSGGPVFLVAHNGRKFDVPFLMKEFERCSMQIPEWWQFIDSVPIAREAMKSKGGKGLSLKLSALHEHYKLPYAGKAHRALADVDMLAYVLQRLTADIELPVSELSKISFTIKDLQSSSDNSLQSKCQELESSSEILEEAEDSASAPSTDSCIPWEDCHVDQTSGMLPSNDLIGSQRHNAEKSYDAETRMEIQTSFIHREDKENVCREKLAAGFSCSETDDFSEMGPGCKGGARYSVLNDADINDLSQFVPVLKQYMQTKKKNPTYLLLWKIGDYYQAFFEDARKIAAVCNIGVAAIKGSELLDGLVPMVSIRSGEVDKCIQQLLEEEFSISQMDQIGIVLGSHTSYQTRANKVLTPGTARISSRLKGCSNCYIVAIVPSSSQDGTWGLAYTDAATGEISATEGRGRTSMAEEILALQPSEIIYPISSDFESPPLLPPGLPPGFHYSGRSSSEFYLTSSDKKLQKFFGSNVLELCGLQNFPVATRAVGGLLGLFEELEGSSSIMFGFHKIESYVLNDFMLLDQCSRSCLEVLNNKRQGALEGSLLWSIDHTKTFMGKRMLRNWLSRPVLDKEIIHNRLDAVEVFVNDSKLREQVRLDLSCMNDVERLAKDILSDCSSPWDLLAMGQSIAILPSLISDLDGLSNPYFQALECPEVLLKLMHKIQSSLEMEAALLQEGQIIKDKVDVTLDSLRKEVIALDVLIKDYEKLEQARTGISSLEIVQNMGGYHLVVKKQEAVNFQVPADYQLYLPGPSDDTDFFITQSLLDRSKKRSELMVKVRNREAEVLKSLKHEVHHHLRHLQIASQAIAAIDVLATLAEVAASRDYCRPVILKDSREITIMGGWHPVDELCGQGRRHANANSLYMGYHSEQPQYKWALYSGLNELSGLLPEESWPRPDVLVLTGPSASGKSCYLQQAGLIQILAQIGSYVPAEEAILSIADAVLAKMVDCDGASTGQSSFELDMKRYASILQKATSHSLLLLDGMEGAFSSRDDSAIMRAIIEHLAQNVKARTILTTQNSNLRCLEEEFSNIANFQCVHSTSSYCVKPGFSCESSIAAVSKIEDFPNWIVERATQLNCENVIMGKEAIQLEEQLHDDNNHNDTDDEDDEDESAGEDEAVKVDHGFSENGITQEELLMHENNLPCDESRRGKALRQSLVQDQTAALVEETQEESKGLRTSVLEDKAFDVEHSCYGDGTTVLQPRRVKHKMPGCEETIAEGELEHLPVDGQVIELNEQSAESKSLEKSVSVEDLGKSELASKRNKTIDGSVGSMSGSAERHLAHIGIQGEADINALKETWTDMLEVLKEYPATHALAKQKGTLVSVQKSMEVARVQICTSALFLKKFSQHEHATALTSAFSMVLTSPVQLNISVAYKDGVSIPLEGPSMSPPNSL